MGTWAQKSGSLWVYVGRGAALIYGYVARQRDDRPSGVVWDALIVSATVAGDTTIAARVPLRAAKLAIEQYAVAHIDEGLLPLAGRARAGDGA